MKTENIDVAIMGVCGLVNELDRTDADQMEVYDDLLDHLHYLRMVAVSKEKPCTNPWTAEVPSAGEVSE